MLFKLFLSFLKIGVISFGGGYGMLPVMRDEILSNGWLTEEEFMNFIAVSESTPGPIAINMATFIGSSQGGILGSFLATLGVVLPSFIIIYLIATILNNLLKYAGVKTFLQGVRPAVAGLIISTGLAMLVSLFISIKTVNDSFNFDWKAVTIFAIILAIAFVFKKLKKKSISPILLIVISAVLGIVFYGLI